MKIDFDEIEQAYMFVSMAPQFANSAIFDKVTGRMYYVSEMGDSDNLPDDVEDSDQYVELPHRNDLELGEFLVRDFVLHHAKHLAEQVSDIFSGKGAYSRFKHLLQSQGLLDVWYKYEEDRTNAALKDWCADNGIEISE